MGYTSPSFLLFLTGSILLYFLFPKKYRWTVLLGASLFFYARASLKGFIYLAVTSLSTYFAGRILSARNQKDKETVKAIKDREEKKKQKEILKKKRWHILLACLILNFGILIFLKYLNFMIDTVNALSGFERYPMLNLLIPLGISFYTFQSMGYVIDIYNGKLEAEKNFFKFLLFVSFFPQIIQGPISMYDQLAHQLYEPHDYDYHNLKRGCELMLWGYFKKMVIADRAVMFLNVVTADYTAYNGTIILLALLVYTVQLYADFSAGIDISRGICEIIGIDMIENFRRPYFAETINDFWRRWHISLGAWMKKYIFYPFAILKPVMNIGKKIKNSSFGKTEYGKHVAKVFPISLSSLVVFMVVGFWHGANWKYAGFGLWNGLIIMFSELLKPVFEKMTQALHIKTASFGFKLFRIIRTLFIVIVGYVFDIAPGLSSSIDMIRRVFFDQAWTAETVKTIADISPINKDGAVILCIAVIILFVVSLVQESTGKQIRDMIDEKPWPLEWAVLFAGMVIVLCFGIYGPGYDAAAFVYMQF